MFDGRGFTQHETKIAGSFKLQSDQAFISTKRSRSLKVLYIIITSAKYIASSEEPPRFSLFSLVVKNFEYNLSFRNFDCVLNYNIKLKFKTKS